LGTPDIYFTTKSGADLSPPVITTTWPTDNATGVDISTQIQISFSEWVKAGSGSIEIRNSSNGALVESIPVTDTSRAVIYSAALYVLPSTALKPGTGYYVVLPAGVVLDYANNSFLGMTSPTSLNFTTLPDTTPPSLISTTPAYGASNVAVGANVSLTFSEAVVAGQGTFEIHRASDGALVASPNATDNSQVTFSGNTVTVNPVGDLQPGEWFYLTFSSGVVKDLEGNAFSGINSPAVLSFETAATSSTPLSLTGNGFSNTLIGGTGNDVITGLGRRDTLTGGGGADTFVYTAVSDSTSRGYDTITDFNASADLIDLWFQVTGVDTAITSGSLSPFTIDSDLASAVGAAKLASHHAVLFTPNAGTLSGKTFLIVEANGVAGYQANADLVILLGNGSSLAGLTAADFV
jgi:methionine-rich copper-binding protein CopC